MSAHHARVKNKPQAVLALTTSFLIAMSGLFVMPAAVHAAEPAAEAVLVEEAEGLDTGENVDAGASESEQTEQTEESSVASSESEAADEEPDVPAEGDDPSATDGSGSEAAGAPAARMFIPMSEPAPLADPQSVGFTLTASAPTVSEGNSVGLVAKPSVVGERNVLMGTLQFLADGVAFGAVHDVKNTAANSTAVVNLVSLPASEGVAVEYTAVFTPADPEMYSGSTSNAVTVTGTAATGPWNPAIQVYLKQAGGTEVPYAGQQVYRGDELVVRGTGFDPEASVGGRGAPLPFGPQGTYVVFGDFDSTGWEPSDGQSSTKRKVTNQGWVLAESVLNTVPVGYQSTVRNQWVEPSGGAWEWRTGPLRTPDLATNGEFGIYTYAAGGAVNAAEELELLIDYVDAPRPGSPDITVYLEDGVTEYSDEQLEAGAKLVVKGTGFDPGANVPGAAGGVPIPNSLPQGTFVVFGYFAENWKPSAGANSDQRVMHRDSRGWALDPEVLAQVDEMFRGTIETSGYTPLNELGEFEWEITLHEPTDSLSSVVNGEWGIYTYAGGASGISNAAQELAVPINFAATPPAGDGDDDESQAVGALQWSFVDSWAGYVIGGAAGTITASDGATKGAGNVIGYEQIGSSYDVDTGLGSISYRGTVVYQSTAHGFNIALKDPRIDFTSTAVTMSAEVSSSDTAGTSNMTRVVVANLASTSPTEGENGTLDWVGVATTIATSVQPETWASRYGGKSGAAISFSLGENAAEPAPTPRVVVEGSVTDIDPEVGAVVTVKGSGFLPAGAATAGTRPPLLGKFTGVYVAFGSFAEQWKPSTGAAASTRSTVDTRWAVPAESMAAIGGERAGAIELKPDGTFETTLTLKLDEQKALEEGTWGIVTYPGGGAKYAPFETFTAITFKGETPPVNPQPPIVPPVNPTPAAGVLAWGVSSAFANYTVGSIGRGSVITSGVGASGGAHLFPQSGSSWDAPTRTGSVSFSGSVTYRGHGGLMNEVFANPVITVTSPISGTVNVHGQTFSLDLARGGFAENSDGSVTWSNVPVIGSISGGDGGGSGGSFGMDPLSFTVGSVNTTNFGSTTTTSPSAAPRTPAATPPATTGVTVVTQTNNITEGGDIEITASGFQPNETGILVVIYSEPIVLDDNAKADANGVVRWIGKLPKGLTGTHTITLQGSINVGKVIAIKAAGAENNAGSGGAQAISATPEQAAPISAPAEGAPVWLWWVGAIALLAIAGAATGVVVAQRKRNGAGTEVL